MSESIVSKKELREKARSFVRPPEAERVKKSRKIVDLILSHPQWSAARQVALYCPLSYEVDLLALWSRRPLHCFFPKVQPGFQISFFRVTELSKLSPGYASIQEPEAIASLRAAAWGKSDLILVPGVLFDRRGGRIGSGKGFYDRFLAGCPAQKWGICFEERLWKETLAQELTDVRMDAVLTDAGFVRGG